MRRPIAQVCLALALAVGCTAGCQDPGAHTYPSDPLFASKKPIEAKAESSAPIAVAYHEPVAPAVPALVLAAAGRDALPNPDPFDVAPRPALTAAPSRTD